MKILTINCTPDLSYFTNKGLKLEIENKTIPGLKFLLKYLYKVTDQSGGLVDLYTPDIYTYLNNIYRTKQYSVILVGWKPDDYGTELIRSGGYTFPKALDCGTYCIGVRQDNPPVNMYPVHEMCHALAQIINFDFKDYKPKDFMDMTPVNGKYLPYYINDPNSTDVNSNFNQTWRGIEPFLSRLNSITYMPIVTITRKIYTDKEAIGELRTFDGKFGCDILELADKNNQKNISCIPKGLYLVKKTFSLKFGFVYEVQNVPNRTAIYIHEGNYFFNSLGCILLGSLPKDINGDGYVDVQNSKLIRKAFEKYLNFEPFTLVIK